MGNLAQDDEYGVPDDENPEITEEQFRWAVKTQDFGDIFASTAFLTRRAEILRAGEAAGLTREYFWQFAPTKPGFEDRVAAALGSVVASTRHAAE